MIHAPTRWLIIGVLLATSTILNVPAAIASTEADADAESRKYLKQRADKARHAMLAGHYDEAGTVYDELIAASTAAFGPADELTLYLQRFRANVYFRLGDLAEAESMTRSGLALSIDGSGEASVETLHYKNNLATIFQAQERFDEAAELFASTIELCREVLGAGHPDTLI
ncbi:tetratricopeptide repeat protein [Parerythrobacter lacustris]|uniref:Tetratricopeptide repeat protein n=1 Tax=Parerythrobacter lacustris TaxID=2969984 RepID=A0ABT1XV30_9SPHN|nr:tetratricopeptide repeat protein [Parerythrobacter lacustris]MCR2834781.1 tetratricopeptide repeat protein [Parerythrobacter lacustris]